MKITIAEDSSLLREGLIRLCEEFGHQVLDGVGSAPDLLESVRHLQPDLVLVDVRIPPFEGDDGITAALSIRSQFPSLAICVLSQYIAARSAKALLADGAGAVGYLLKDRIQDLDQFAQALEQVRRGGVVIDPQVVSQLVRAPGAASALTPREREVLELMAQGRSNQGIGEDLSLSLGAVEKNISSIYQKFDLLPSSESHRRVLAVLKVLDAEAAL